MFPLQLLKSTAPVERFIFLARSENLGKDLYNTHSLNKQPFVKNIVKHNIRNSVERMYMNQAMTAFRLTSRLIDRRIDRLKTICP